MKLTVNQIEQKLEESKVTADRLLDDKRGEPFGVPIALIAIEPGRRASTIDRLSAAVMTSPPR